MHLDSSSYSVSLERRLVQLLIFHYPNLLNSGLYTIRFGKKIIYVCYRKGGFYKLCSLV